MTNDLYLVVFLKIAEHDDTFASVLIDHFPEVGDGGFQGTLRGNEGLCVLVALKISESIIYMVTFIYLRGEL